MRDFLLRMLTLLAVMLPIIVIIIVGISIYPMEPPVEQTEPAAATRPARNFSQRDAGTEREDLPPSGILIDNTRTIQVTIRRLKFTPDPIVILEGETVRLEVTSHDAAHNIVIEELAIATRVEPMVPKTIEFQADRSGRYPMVCTINCGIGDQHLEGEVVIRER